MYGFENVIRANCSYDYGVECRRPDRRMFDINRFLYKLRDRGMYTSIFKSKAKRKTSATVTGIFEGVKMAFASCSRTLLRSRGVFLAGRWSNKESGEGAERSLVCWSERGGLNKGCK
jgi:hypothetical protein